MTRISSHVSSLSSRPHILHNNNNSTPQYSHAFLTRPSFISRSFSQPSNQHSKQSFFLKTNDFNISQPKYFNHVPIFTQRQSNRLYSSTNIDIQDFDTKDDHDTIIRKLLDNATENTAARVVSVLRRVDKTCIDPSDPYYLSPDARVSAAEFLLQYNMNSLQMEENPHSSITHPLQNHLSSVKNQKLLHVALEFLDYFPEFNDETKTVQRDVTYAKIGQNLKDGSFLFEPFDRLYNYYTENITDDNALGGGIETDVIISLITLAPHLGRFREMAEIGSRIKKLEPGLLQEISSDAAQDYNSNSGSDGVDSSEEDGQGFTFDYNILFEYCRELKKKQDKGKSKKHEEYFFSPNTLYSQTKRGETVPIPLRFAEMVDISIRLNDVYDSVNPRSQYDPFYNSMNLQYEALIPSDPNASEGEREFQRIQQKQDFQEISGQMEPSWMDMDDAEFPILQWGPSIMWRQASQEIQLSGIVDPAVQHIQMRGLKEGLDSESNQIVRLSTMFDVRKISEGRDQESEQYLDTPLVSSPLDGAYRGTHKRCVLIRNRKGKVLSATFSHYDVKFRLNTVAQ